MTMRTWTARPPRAWNVVAAIAIVAATASCQRYRQMRDCSAVIDIVNSALEGIGGSAEGELDQLPLEKAEKAYQTIHTELGQLRVDDKALAALVRTHRGLLNRTTRTLRSLRNAAKGKGKEKEVDRLVKSLKQIQGSAAASEAQLNRHCHQRF